MERTYDYGFWWATIISSAIFIAFAFSFVRPNNRRDWRSFGAFSAFVVALFTEMYGFPLTLYLLSGWLGSLYPQLNLFAHENGHLRQTILGGQTVVHFSILHILNNVLIVAGFGLIASAWRILFSAQKTGTLATSGPYARIRHPQYVGFIAVITGFLLRRPTVLTVLMFPVLVWRYVQSSRTEEIDVAKISGEGYDRYAEKMPRYWPRMTPTFASVSRDAQL